jgi:cephalosporin-C deacetylase-like acetyl esterase
MVVKYLNKSGRLMSAGFIRIAVCIPVFLFGAALVQAQDNALAWKNNLAYNAYLMRGVHAQYATRNEQFQKALSSAQMMEAYLEKVRASYKKIVGNFPAKSALKPQVISRRQFEGYSVENIVFESKPGRLVSANLYLPAGSGTSPAVLLLAGHGMAGKASEQRAAITLVQNGMAVLAVDPVGQGERIQLLDDTGKSVTRGSTTEHTLLNAGANLTGTSVAAIEYWDNHRALDYLETRKEIDASRLGCIGSSGGGTQTTYMLGLDDRIKVAVVCSYVSKRERVLELNGPSDGCQHIPYEGKAGLEIGDFLLMFAPKPLLIMSGLYDFVDYWGAQQTYGELDQAYSVLGQKEKVKFFAAETGHGMPKPKREVAASWFRDWFFQDKKPVQELAANPVAEKELWTGPTGQLLKDFPQTVSIPAAHTEESKLLAAERSMFLKQDNKTIRGKVEELLGMGENKNLVSAEPTGSALARNYTVNKYQLIRTGEMPVPVIVIYPESISKNGNVIIWLNEDGKSNVLRDEKTLEAYINRGDILVLADLRGQGETTDPAELNDTKYWNKEYRNAMISMHIGKPIMGQRVTDIQSITAFIKSEQRLKGQNIVLRANGVYGPAAIHAAYLNPDINSTEISRSIKSFDDIVSNPLQRDVYSNVLYGVLKYYDLKDLAEKTGKGSVKFLD